MNGWEVPSNARMEEVLRWCVRRKRADRLLLVAQLKDVRQRVLSDASVETVVENLFGETVLKRRLARRWPGTELSDSKALVYVIAFNETFIQPMVELGPLLSDWKHSHQPPMPEDPCLFRHGDEWPVFVSVTHEGDAWALSDGRPPFGKGKPFEFKPENLMIPPAALGFLG